MTANPNFGEEVEQLIFIQQMLKMTNGRSTLENWNISYKENHTTTLWLSDFIVR